MTSKQPRKQRVRRRDASLHERHRYVRSPLSEELREEFGRRNARVCQGDTVEVLRGDFTGHEDEVVRVVLDDCVVHVDGVTIETADGEEVARPLQASNLRITTLNRSDPIRIERLEQEAEGDDE